MKRSRLTLVLAGCAVATALIIMQATVARGAPQPQEQPQVVQVQQAQPVAQPQVQPAPVTVARPRVPGTEEFRVNTLSATSFVVVKDFGDHQLVIVYQVDDKGKVSQTDKKKFFY
jgi:hypothetical protein